MSLDLMEALVNTGAVLVYGAGAVLCVGGLKLMSAWTQPASPVTRSGLAKAGEESPPHEYVNICDALGCPDRKMKRERFCRECIRLLTDKGKGRHDQ